MRSFKSHMEPNAFLREEDQYSCSILGILSWFFKGAKVAPTREYKQ